MSYKYFNLQEAFIDLQKAGENLKKEKILKDISPLIFGVTGARGRVGSGAIEILKFFPCKFVTFEEIEVMFQDKENPDYTDHIYIVGKIYKLRNRLSTHGAAQIKLAI